MLSTSVCIPTPHNNPIHIPCKKKENKFKLNTKNVESNEFKLLICASLGSLGILNIQLVYLGCQLSEVI